MSLKKSSKNEYNFLTSLFFFLPLVAFGSLLVSRREMFPFFFFRLLFEIFKRIFNFGSLDTLFIVNIPFFVRTWLDWSETVIE